MGPAPADLLPLPGADARPTLGDASGERRGPEPKGLLPHTRPLPGVDARPALICAPGDRVGADPKLPPPPASPPPGTDERPVQPPGGSGDQGLPPYATPPPAPGERPALAGASDQETRICCARERSLASATTSRWEAGVLIGCL